MYDLEKAGCDEIEIEVQEGRLHVLIRNGDAIKFEAVRVFKEIADYVADNVKVDELDIELFTEVLS